MGRSANRVRQRLPHRRAKCDDPDMIPAFGNGPGKFAGDPNRCRNPRSVASEIAMEIRPFRTEADCRASLEVVAPYFDQEPEPGSVESDRFELLLMVIEAYESKYHANDTPDPVEANQIPYGTGWADARGSATNDRSEQSCL